MLENKCNLKGHGQLALFPKLEPSVTSWLLDQKSVNCPKSALKREYVVDTSGLGYHEELRRTKKLRRKSVQFKEELENIFAIPTKEETWPYGSISKYDDSGPKVFPEFDSLYGPVKPTTTTKCVNSKRQAVTKHFENFKGCVGLSFLMFDGSIMKGVCATSNGIWGKKYIKLEHLQKENKRIQLRGLRPADYIETDIYAEIRCGEVAAMCHVVCCGDSVPAKGKVFHYGWYYSSATKKSSAHSVGRKVEVYWSDDDAWYSGTITGAKNGLHEVEYDIDGSSESINLQLFRQDGIIRYI